MNALEIIHAIDPHARRLWDATTGNGDRLSCFAAGDATLILHEYRDNNGFEIYTPATLKNSIGFTIHNAREQLNIKNDAIDWPMR